jgi:hypothetical protein
MVRLPSAVVAYRRRVAAVTTHPAGMGGRGNPTRTRQFSPFLDWTYRFESVPLFLFASLD